MPLVPPAAASPGPVAAAPAQPPPPPPARGPVTQSPVNPVATLGAARPGEVRIPAIGVSSSLVDLGLNRDGSLQVPNFGSAGWYVSAPTPGELGPAVIAAHVSSRRGPDVFARIDELVPGDEVQVPRADGSVAVFHVVSTERAPKNAFPTDRVYGNIDHAGLRLITCGGSFDSSTGHFRDNVIVYARLAGTLA